VSLPCFTTRNPQDVPFHFFLLLLLVSSFLSSSFLSSSLHTHTHQLLLVVWLCCGVALTRWCWSRFSSILSLFGTSHWFARAVLQQHRHLFGCGSLTLLIGMSCVKRESVPFDTNTSTIIIHHDNYTDKGRLLLVGRLGGCWLLVVGCCLLSYNIGRHINQVCHSMNQYSCC
jgi:hypothetical protein